MSKIIHLGFDGNIFLDEPSRNKLSYSKGLVEFKKQVYNVHLISIKI